MSIWSLVLELWQFSFIRDMGLTRNPEIGNTPVWVLPNTCRLGQVMDTKFGTSVAHKILLKAAKFQGYSSSCFWVIKGKPTGRGGKITPHPPPRLGLSTNPTKWSNSLKIVWECLTILWGWRLNGYEYEIIQTQDLFFQVTMVLWNQPFSALFSKGSQQTIFRSIFVTSILDPGNQMGLHYWTNFQKKFTNSCKLGWKTTQQNKLHKNISRLFPSTE